MKLLMIEPRGWPCALKEAPPGHFLFTDTLCFKSEYHTPVGEIEAYTEAGEFFCAGSEALVQPVIAVWEEA